MQAATLRPLAGMKILITRPKAKAHEISTKLHELGASTIELSTIEIAPPKNTSEIDCSIRNLSSYDWVIFTSVHGVQFFFERLHELGLGTKVFFRPKVAAIGPSTAAALERAGRTPDYVPKEYLSEKIALGLGEVHGSRILLPRADIASKKLPNSLRERGCVVDEIIAYRTIIPRGLTRERIKAVFSKDIDVITFTSPSTIRNLAQVLDGENLPDILGKSKVACIGPVTCQAAKEYGINVTVVAQNHTIDALVEAIVNEVRTV